MFRQALAHKAWAFLLAISCFCAAPAASYAQETLADTTSLGQVPEDVGYYSALFNGRQVYDAIVNSQAVQRVLELPTTQEAFDEMREEMDAEGFFELLADPENQQLVELLQDMASHEIYICGDEGLADMLDLYSECLVETVSVNFQLMMEGQYGMGEIVAVKATLDVLERRHEELELPNIVIAFKLTDQAGAAEDQLARLEELLLVGIAQLPEIDADLPDLEGRLERVPVGDDEFLTLRIDGELVPWEMFGRGLEEIGSSLDDYADLIAALKERELLISLGVRDGYAILAVGPSHDYLASLGEGPALWEREELAPLREAELAAEEIFAVSYISNSMAQRMDNARRTINTYLGMGEAMASLGAGPSATAFLNDIPELRRDLFSLLPDQRAKVSFSYFTERGVEGYIYNHSENLPVDGSQTLPILQHGGDPLLMVAGRTPYSTHTYELAAKWFEKAYGYWEMEVKQWAGPDEARMIDNMSAAAAPLLKELDSIIVTMFLPSMADGQSALVLDAEMTSESWSQWMDPPEAPLPMVEVGMVIGLSDADLLVESCTSGREVINDLIEEVRDATGGEIGADEDFYLPAPTETEVEGGTMYSYPWEDMEFHEEINPNAVVSEDWLVLSLSPDHSQRLLAESELPQTPPLARRDEPLAGMVYINVAGAVEAIEPWVDYFAAGNDMDGQRVYGTDVWEQTAPAEEWEGGQGEDPFEEDPFGEEMEGEADPFGEDPFGEESRPEQEDDLFGDEDPFEDRPAHEFEGEHAHGDFRHGDDYYHEPRRRHTWGPGEVEATIEAYLNLGRSVQSFSAAIYEEDEVLVTHFEWHLVDAGSSVGESAAEDIPAEESATE